MSLNDIQLQPTSIRELYSKSLVEIKSNKTTVEAMPAQSLSILGKNLKGIVLVVSNAEAAFVTDDELNFLLGILSACKLNMDDVGILNIRKHAAADYKNISAELRAEKVFLFGVDPAEIKLPLSFPYYQVQRYNDQTYLASPALAEIQNDKAEKTKLWNCLKQIFSI
jgi:DNA polymerase III psi subunit